MERSRGVPIRIVVAPDKFRSTLDARGVAEALVTGARRVHPDASFNVRPLADGGEGTLEALLAAVGGTAVEIEVDDPLGRPVPAEIGLLDDGRAVIEMALPSGLGRVPEDERDPLAASSRGTGQMIRYALEQGCRELVVGVGGSASTDGGTGAATAIGWRFLDARGQRLPPGGGELVRLARIDGDKVMDAVMDASIQAACDVSAPLTGPGGAAAVYAPQKGATVAQARRLAEGLENLAQRISEDLGAAVAELSGAGAGGGMAAGLVAFFGGRLASGFEVIADAGALRSTIAGADLVITGEGHIDEQTLSGKAPVGVAGLARSAGIPCVAVAGRVSISPTELKRHGIEAAASLVDSDARELAFADPGAAISATIASLLRERQRRQLRGGRR